MSLLLDASASARVVPADRPLPPPPTSSNGTTPLHTSSAALPYNLQASLLQAAPATKGPSFDAQVRGQDAKSIDMDLAKLSKDVYNTDPTRVGNWSRLSDAQLEAAGIKPAELESKATGFRSAIYQDGKGHYVLAFAGTDPKSGKDWLADGLQASGLPTAQYSQAVALATKAKTAFHDNLVITGHSLGGGLASAASVATDSAAVTFNAAGLNNATLRRAVPNGDPGTLRTQAENGLVRRYAVDGEVLTGEQEQGAGRGLAPDAIGHKIELRDPSPTPWILQAPGLNLVTDTVHGGQLHGMGSVLDALSKDQPWNPGADNGKSVTDRIADGIETGADKTTGGIDFVKNHGKDAVGKASNFAGNVIEDHVGGLPGKILGGTVKLGGTLLKGGIEVGGDLLDGAVGLSAHLLQGTEKFLGGAIKTTVDGAKWVGHATVGAAKAVGHATVSAVQGVGHAAVATTKAIGHGISRAMPWNW